MFPQIRNHQAMVFRQFGYERLPELSATEKAVQKNKRLALAIDLVIHLESVDWCGLAFGRTFVHRRQKFLSKRLVRLSRLPPVADCSVESSEAWHNSYI
jgi:hypothetical protein